MRDIVAALQECLSLVLYISASDMTCNMSYMTSVSIVGPQYNMNTHMERYESSSNQYSKLKYRHVTEK